MPTASEILDLHASSTLVDLHAHPCMKTYLSKKKLYKQAKTDKGFSPLNLRCNLPALESGDVDVVLSAIYVPEAQLKKDCWVLKPVTWFNGRLRRALKDDPFETTIKMIESLESEVNEANGKTKGRKVVIAHSLTELDAALSATKPPIVFLHTVEGAHSLSANPGHIKRLYDLGVCLLTLAHFYPNQVSPPVIGIPLTNSLRKLGCFKWTPDVSQTLPALGKEVVATLLELGMLVDLTHTTPPARREVMEINHARGGNARPLVLSHAGAASLFDDPMNPQPDEVKRIADTGGIIGVIFMTDWLVGPHEKDQDILARVVETVKRLVDEGGEDCVGLGSDFDGMTDPPNDLRDPSEMQNLTKALLQEFTAEQVKKFLGGNALRVIRNGWTRR